MNNLIQTVTDWLIASHSISMAGWAWLIVIPAALIIMIIIMYFLILLILASFASSFRIF